VLDVGTTFTFGFWFCIANGRGGFNSHLADTREPTGICSSILPRYRRPRR
jgi:hypothetical protein